MKYMLDTNIIVYAKNNRPKTVFVNFQRYTPKDMCISAITMAELEFGICNSSKPEQNRLALAMFLSGIEIAPFDKKAAEEYGKIRFDLKMRGLLIGSNDMLIAAHAKSLGLTLISNNTREFERIDGLKLENWV